MVARVIIGDCRERLPELAAQSAHCIVTSPPYWKQRRYTDDAREIGIERGLDHFIQNLCAVFRAARRVLRDDGTCWINIDDTYSDGMLLIPERLVFDLWDDGWQVQRRIVWHKPNAMPEGGPNRPTSSHELIYMLTKSKSYFYDAEAVREPGSQNSHGGAPIQGGPKQEAMGQQKGGRMGIPAGPNGRHLRDVWSIATVPFAGAHTAPFPPALVEKCIKASCPIGGTVLDPFGGAGTVGLVADRLQRDSVLIELNPAYAEMAGRRIKSDAPLFQSLGETQDVGLYV
jgi:DNA modification methylase